MSLPTEHRAESASMLEAKLLLRLSTGSIGVDELRFMQRMRARALKLYRHWAKRSRRRGSRLP